MTAARRTHSASASGSRIEPASGARQEALDERAGLILTALVENFIATGDPVSSLSLARQQNREGLSAATIRNVMAELSEAGYLEQPHTSAGRIPTARAFRFYAERLLRQSTPALPVPAQTHIAESVAGATSSSDFLARTSHLLAAISGGLGVALTVPGENDRLEHVHFTRLGPQRVLAVLVTAAGAVRDRILKLGRDSSAGELEQAANYLNVNFRGWVIEGIRQELERRLAAERSEYGRTLASLTDLWGRWIVPVTDDVPENSPALRSPQEETLFVEGFANLMAGDADRERLRRILSTLEEKQRIIELLNAYIDSRHSTVRVVVGLEDAMPEMAGLVLVAAPARLGEQHLGTVGVIGPTRMPYASAIGGVTYLAALFARWAAEP